MEDMSPGSCADNRQGSNLEELLCGPRAGGGRPSSAADHIRMTVETLDTHVSHPERLTRRVNRGVHEQGGYVRVSPFVNQDRVQGACNSNDGSAFWPPRISSNDDGPVR